MKGDAKSFWAKWNAQFRGPKKNYAYINGNNDPEVVAHEFVKYFESNYVILLQMPHRKRVFTQHMMFSLLSLRTILSKILLYLKLSLLFQN